MRLGLGDLSNLSDPELFATWVATLEELRRRGLVRSANNPTGDYAERLVIDALGLTQQTNAMAGYDAIDLDGTRYQIKSRRLTTSGASRQLSPLRNLLHEEPRPFDFLIILLFGPGFEVTGCWQIPIEVVRRYAKFRAHVNGHVLHARGVVLSDPQAIQLDLAAAKS